MTETESTHAALLTPPGRGAVASLLIEGPRACRVLAGCFAPVSGRDAESLPIDRVVFGRWTAPPAAGEEVVVARRSGERLEVHCHGGDAVSRAMLDSLAARGCRPRAWRELLAAIDHALAVSAADDRLAVEARLALADASTVSTAAILLDQWRGALRREVDSLRRLLADSSTDAGPQALDSRLQALLQSGELGLHLTQPFRVVLAGRVNVGKSSLINALLGYGRALVYDRPGTTRDVVTADTAIGGWPVELSDTAGLRAGAETLEVLGIQRARERMAAADLIVAVLDGSQPLIEEDLQLLELTRDPLVVFNKCDRGLLPDASRPSGLPVSALTGEGIERFTEAIVHRLVPVRPASGHPVPFTVRQLDLLQAAHDAFKQNLPDEARQLLGQL